MAREYAYRTETEEPLVFKDARNKKRVEVFKGILCSGAVSVCPIRRKRLDKETIACREKYVNVYGVEVEVPHCDIKFKNKRPPKKVGAKRF